VAYFFGPPCILLFLVGFVIREKFLVVHELQYKCLVVYPTTGDRHKTECQANHAERAAKTDLYLFSKNNIVNYYYYYD